MSDFYSEVSCAIEALPSKAAHNLNIVLLLQKEKQGIDVKKFLMKNTLYAAVDESPLTALLNKGGLTQDEYRAGLKYCEYYEIAHISHHARPNYDGTPISSASTNFTKEKSLSDSQLNAASRVEKAQAAIAARNQPRQVKEFKSFKDSKKSYRRVTTTNKKYLELLELAFHQKIAIRAIEKKLGMNHSIVEERMQEICGILLTLLTC